MSDELLDVVNDNDEVTGQEMRSVIHQQGLQHRGVHVFMFNEKGEMLIQKRSSDRVNSPLLLDCSVSEHVKAGESYLEAAVRGLREELDLQGIEIDLLGKIQMEYGFNDLEISEIYVGRLTSEHVNFDPVEIAEIRFMSMDELQNEIIHQKGLYCRWFVELLNWYFHTPANLNVLKNKE